MSVRGETMRPIAYATTVAFYAERSRTFDAGLVVPNNADAEHVGSVLR